ncbi:MAG: type II secretion system F family protein, partial [Pseudomonadota bacterium]
LETGAKRRGALVSALIYPAFLVVTSIGAVAILLGFVVPSFKPLMDEAGVDPPAITSAVIAVGGFVESWWAVMIAALAALVLIARLALARPRLRLAWHRTALALPVLGTLWAKFETARLTRLLGTLLQNGVALPAAMKLTRGALSNHAFMAEMDRVIPEVEAGRGVAAPFAEGGLLPALARQLIQVGQESGQLTAMLLKAADIFDEEARRDFDRLLSLVTPLLTLVMGGVVAVIISSILLALLSINDLAI